MTHDHNLTRLRTADPVTWLRDETDAYAPPPRHVMERIVASTPPPPPRGRWRRRLVLAAATASVAAAAALGALQLLPSNDRVDLAARAYAATAPGDSVIYTKLTLEESLTPGRYPGPEPDGNRVEEEIWHRGDRVHRIKTLTRVGGDDAGWRRTYEYEQRGDERRVLNPDGTVEVLRVGDPVRNPEATRQVLEHEQRTIVERFRARYADAMLRDAGETLFAGRSAHAYRVIGHPVRKGAGTPTISHETFYLDPASGLPLGSATVISYPGALTPKAIPPAASPYGEQRLTEMVDRYERLPSTPENLAKLDAPAIDAAASEPLGRPRRERNPKG